MADLLGPGPALPVCIPLATWADFDWSRAEDMHMHTTHVDGTASVAAMAAAAKARGLSRILLTEHIRADSVYFPDFVSEIRAVAEAGLSAYVGAETKVCSLAGELDISSAHARACDALVASVHRPPPEFSSGAVKWATLDRNIARDLEFRLALAIVEKSQATILGHPMGMYLRAFDDVAEPELRILADACRVNGKVFELNARYCPDPKRYVRIVRDAKCRVTIASDAHSPEALGTGWATFAGLCHD